MQLPIDSLQPTRHLYVHIPFCRHKCGYCDFNAYAGMDALMPAYVESLIEELTSARARLPFEPLRTLYLGGGTPSLLPVALLERLFSALAGTFGMQPDAEVTLEANPASTDPQKLAAWRGAGVNRVSLGVQGFDPRALSVLERRTDGAQAERAFRQAREAGFDNMNVDLIYAVPFQSPYTWEATLERAIGMGAEHVSCYCLTIEEGTLLARRVREGSLPSVDVDLQWSLLDTAARRLEAAGYRRYEVSNWALPGRESRHNQAYWECRPVYGAGAGAHSYATDGDRAWRWWNLARPRAYIASAHDPVEGGEELPPRKARAEALMMGLRTAAGLVSPPGFEAELDQLAELGLVVAGGGRVAPTRRGLDLHNQIALTVL